MNIFNAILQGVIQGLTEFLPVSSSGHLNIIQHITGMEEDNLFFSVMLHIGTLAAVVGVYIKLIFRLLKAFGLMVRDIFTGKFKWKEMDNERNMVMMLIIGLVPLFFLFLPIPGTDMRLKDLADLFSKSGYLIVVGLSLMTTGTLLYIGDRKNKKMTDLYKQKGVTRKGGAGRRKYTVTDALAVGFTQCAAALFPGLSRSGSTLVASELRGMNKQVALDYSFLLGTPAIVAAALLEGKDALFPKDGAPVTVDYWCVIVGMVVAAFVGFLAIKLFKWLLQTNRMIIFVGYTIGVGELITIISVIELVKGCNIFSGMPLQF